MKNLRDLQTDQKTDARLTRAGGELRAVNPARSPHWLARVARWLSPDARVEPTAFISPAIRCPQRIIQRRREQRSVVAGR